MTALTWMRGRDDDGQRFWWHVDPATDANVSIPCDAHGWIDALRPAPGESVEITAQMQNGRRYTDKRSAFLWSAVVAWQPAPPPYVPPESPATAPSA